MTVTFSTMEMSAGKPDYASGMMLLREVVRRPLDYGLDHPHACLTNVLAFSNRSADCLRDDEASALRKIERCLQTSQPRRSDADALEHRLRRQLLEVKQDLAWTELDHRLGVDSRYWNADRYARLAKGLCVLAALWRYRRRRFPQAPPYASSVAAARLARLWQLKQRGWKALQDHLDRSGLDWRAGMTAHLEETNQSLRGAPERTHKSVCRDQDGNTWMVKYKPEGLMNPALASVFTRLSGCPGAEVCPSFLDYDRRAKRPCSVQPHISARPLPRITHTSHRLARLIEGDRRRASQILCQAVAQWILENIDGYQIIIDEFGNCIWVDHDRSFFIDDRRVATDWRAAWEARSKAAASAVSSELIKATAPIPGVLQDLAAFVARVEAIPAAAFEGLVRNASFREDQLCSLFYLDVMDSRALGSVRALERWIDHLLARKATVRAALTRRLREVLGNVECSLSTLSR
jgi:hypothetical protein